MNVITQIGYSVSGLILGSILLACTLYSIEYIKYKKWQRKEMKEFLEYKKMTDEKMARMKDW